MGYRSTEANHGLKKTTVICMSDELENSFSRRRYRKVEGHIKSAGPQKF